MRLPLKAWVCLSVLAAGLMGAAPPAEGPSPGRELTPAARRAVEKGLRYLVRTQNPEGSWFSRGHVGRFPVAITSLCGLALLESGSTAYSGPHAGNVRRAADYVLSRADPETGLIGANESARPMFGHGFAMLFLAEVYGSEAQTALRARIRDALGRAVQLTTRSQSDRGGWFYTPESEEDEGAVTITQVQGLRACADAGIPVPEQTVRRAMDYIRGSARPDGGIAYKVDHPGGSRPAITCAAVATMYAAGTYEGELVENALDYALRNVPTSAPRPTGGSHFYYAHLYLSQVLYFRDGTAWRDYFADITRWLVEVQKDDGSWVGEYIGKGYGTAVALLIMQLPRHALPVLQR